MDKSIEQVERNVAASFGYVKKDLLLMNDAISNLQEQIHRVIENQKALVEKLNSLNESKPKTKTKKTAEKEKLEFYDVKTKRRFKSDEYKYVMKSNRKFAVAKSPFGDNEVYRIVSQKKK
jgi:hypothetical protein